MYSGFKSFTRYAVCKAYLPVNASISKSLPVIFWRTKFYILTKPNLSFCFFMVLNVGLMYKNSLPNSMTYFLPCYQKFYAFLFIFRYIIYFNLFLYQVWSMYLFFFLQIYVQFFQDHLLKRLSFLFFFPLVRSCLCTFVDVSWRYFCMSMSGIYILFHLSIRAYYLSVSYYLEHYCLISLETGHCTSASVFWSVLLICILNEFLNQHIDIYQKYLLDFYWGNDKSKDQIE